MTAASTAFSLMMWRMNDAVGLVAILALLFSLLSITMNCVGLSDLSLLTANGAPLWTAGLTYNIPLNFTKYNYTVSGKVPDYQPFNIQFWALAALCLLQFVMLFDGLSWSLFTPDFPYEPPASIKEYYSVLTSGAAGRQAIQFKFLKIAADGTVTWENGANHQYAVPASGVGTVNVNWQN